MYTIPGFQESTNSVHFIRWAETIHKLANWEAELRDKVWSATTLRGSRFANHITLEALVASGSLKAGAFRPDSEEFSAFLHLMSRWLFANGIVKTYPALIEYRVSPYLTFDECVDRMITTMLTRAEKGSDGIWTSFTKLGGANTRVEDLITAFPALVKQLRTFKSLRPVLAKRLQTMLAHIGYKIAVGQSIDQWERSFFVAYNDGDVAGPGYSQYSPAAKLVAVAETGDSNVFEAWELLKLSVENGPFLRFFKLVSNASMPDLYYYFGPMVSKVEIAIGLTSSVGPFKEPIVERTESWAWTTRDQEAAHRERAGQIDLTDGLDPFGFRSPKIRSQAVKPYRFSTPQGMREEHFNCEGRMDLPEIVLRMHNGTESHTTEFDCVWYSKVRAKMVTESNVAVLLTDLAITRNAVGGGLTTNLSLHSWPLYDPAYLNIVTYPNTSFPASSFTKLVTTADMQAIVYYPYGDRLLIERIDMSDFFMSRGGTMWTSAFSEFALVPLEQLSVVDESAVSYIASLLQRRRGLNSQELLTARRAIAMSYQAFRFERLLGHKNAWPELNLPSLLANLAGVAQDKIYDYGSDGSFTKHVGLTVVAKDGPPASAPL